MSNRYQHSSWTFLRFAIGALALAGAMVLWNAYPTYSVSANEALKPFGEADTPASFANVIEAVKPAVVNIAVNGHKTATVQEFIPGDPFGGQGVEPSPFDDFLRRFFDGGAADMQQRAMPFQAMGTGFIISPDGEVVTNYHVVQDAEQINVIMDDGTQHDAKLLGYDEKTDIALLDIDGDNLPFVAFGDSDAVRVGDWIVAIGNPFGLGGSATTGIVSARGRDIQSGPFDDFLQIDAPINRGNSGGPLFDLNGKVVGVNTAIFSPNGGNIGIGFAIPSAQVEDIVNELRDKGHIDRGWLGVNVQGIDQDMASGLGLDSARGALVASVVDGSPAADAGVVAGDVILGIDGKELTDVRELVRTVGDSDPGDSVDLEVWRMGKTEHLHATLAQADEDTNAPVVTEEHEADHSTLGLAVENLDSNMRRRLRLGDDVNGVVIRSVGRDGVAAEHGLRPGDVIVGVGQMPVSSVGEFNDAVDQVTDSGRDAVVLQVLRDGVRTFVALPLR